jgi:hypothetical protein
MAKLNISSDESVSDSYAMPGGHVHTPGSPVQLVRTLSRKVGIE